MPRKKKIIEDFIPSEYQKNIFNELKNSNKNILIEAAAGSGKTSTLIKCISFIPKDKTILFCAFNKDIVKDIEKKTKEYDNVDVRTVHSLGFLMIQRNLNTSHLNINENKYRTYLYNNINNYTSINLSNFDKQTFIKYIDNICKLINFCRYNLINKISDIEKIIEMHNIDIIADEINVTIDILHWGTVNIEEIDYTDMIWLPNILNMKPIGVQYDFIFGDEAQDFSIAQRELIFKCRKDNTRLIFCGDKNQCIYSFASASIDNFDKLKEIPNTITLPLSISYRCAQNIVKFAQNIVPSIEPNNDGRIGEIKYNVDLNEVTDGDMVICRNNAPLMEAYSEFIRNGKKCFIRGKDIGINLKKMVSSTNKKELNQNLENDGVFVRLYYDYFKNRDKIINKTGLDLQTVMNMPIISNELDMIHALEVLSENINTSDQLIEKIKKVFSDKKQDGIALSTIHKAKGLEANNVFIVCKSLMPSKSATKKWEIEQEKNLMYVAYTRAKNNLYFIDEKLFKKQSTKESLQKIEHKIYETLRKNKKTTKLNIEMAKIIANNIKQIELPKSNFTYLGKKNNNIKTK